eukprot:5094221-Pleurochrysis_carterae.AAC.2
MSFSQQSAPTALLCFFAHGIESPALSASPWPSPRNAEGRLLGIVFVAKAGILFLPRDEAPRAVTNIKRVLAHAAHTAALQKVCGLPKQVRDVWTDPPS